MKQLTRIKILSLVFILLGIASFFALKEKYSTDTIVKEEGGIAVDTSLVNKITIVKEGITQTLTKSPRGEWVVNNKFKVRVNVINLLLVGLNKLEIKRPVSDESRKKVYDQITKSGATLTIDLGETKRVLKFASNPNDYNSTYILSENSDVPYIAYVPGVPGDINNVFKLSETDLRSRELFTSSPQTIQNISISYPSDPAGNMEVEFKSGDFSLKNVDNLDTAKFYQFLQFFSYIPVSGYLNAQADSIQAKFAKNPVYAVIQLTDIDEAKSNSLTIFKDPADNRNYLGKIGKTGEPVLLNKELYDRVLVKKSFFVRR